MEKLSTEDMVKKHLAIKKEIDRKIKTIETIGHKVSELKENEKTLKSFILHDQINKGEILEDPALDYCFRHFDENIYKHLELVNEFRDQIKKYSGQQILTVRENKKLDIGIISGGCGFEVDKSFRYLYVPVKDLQTFQMGEGYTGKWKKQGDKIWIEEDIFNVKKIRIEDVDPEKNQKILELLTKITPRSKPRENLGEYWDADYSREMCIGGPCPNNYYVYIGDKIVKHNLNDHLEINIPQTKMIIPSYKF